MMRRWIIKTWVGALLILGLAGCGGSVGNPDNPPAVDGKVVVDFPADTLKQKLLKEKTPGVDENTTVFGYTAYRIEYDTTDEKGQSVRASGLMVVPSDTGVDAATQAKLEQMRRVGLSVVEDAHGTIFADREAPTVVAEATMEPEGSPILLSALGGFVTLQPDYIGFGASAGHVHPYLLDRPSAQTMIDFVRAAKSFAQKNGIPLNGQLYLTGYSEGGYVAMAALKAIEAGEDPGLTTVAAAPMAGPYMMDRMAQGVLSQPRLPIPSFIAAVGYSYSLAYGHELNETIQEPWASDLPNLFDGSLSREEIDAQLPHATTGSGGLFTAQAVNGVLKDPNFWLSQALLANSTAYWAPQTPIYLAQCMGDDVIPFAMSQGTQKVMQKMGAASVTLIPVEAAITGDPHTSLRLGHAECAAPAYGVAAHLFAKIRKSSVGY